MALNNVVVLVGGVGGAKLALGLARILSPERLTIIVNTGDDFWHFGLRVCPDLDTITYTLADLVNTEFGWGLAGDTRNMLSMLAQYGEEPWFGLGDKDLATHLLRTQMLRDGHTLTEVTSRLARGLGVGHPILPMTDDPVATVVDTVEYGELDFQTYFVRYGWQPVVRALRLDGIEAAQMTEPVRAALKAADVVLIGPSNPWLSIDPILRVPGMRAALTARDIPRVAVTPIIGGQAVKGPAAKLMAELRYMVDAKSVAMYYGDVINGFVFDETDTAVPLPNLRTTALQTFMKTLEDRTALAHNVLDWIEQGWG